MEYHFAAAMFEHMRLDDRNQEQILEDSRWPPNPLVTKGLTQVTMGSPQPVYNGGLVRYFDAQQRRPGLERHVGLWLSSDRTWTDYAVQLGGSHLEVQMPPSTSIRLSCGLRRFVSKPSSALPWD